MTKTTTAYLSELFSKHGLTCVIENDWIVPNAGVYRKLWLPSSEGVTPHIPHELFPEIEHAIKGESLTQDTHWFRFFFCNVTKTRRVGRGDQVAAIGDRALSKLQPSQS